MVRKAAARVPLIWAWLVGAVALLPRMTDLTDFFTTDEAYHWIDRVAGFSKALATGNLFKTSQTGHPGVTIMWLGTLGTWAEQLAVRLGWAQPPSEAQHLAWLRAPHALLEALLVPLIYLLLRRLVSPLAAMLASLLIALSPYLIAHGRLLHLDALLTSFATLCVLFLLVDMQEGSWRWLAGSGVCAGLALLTKGPALILLPFVGLAMCVPAAQRLLADLRGGARPNVAALAWQVVRRYLIWLGVAALVVVALWPALWVQPVWILNNYWAEIRDNGARANGDGQFFMGQAIADPGPLFYLVAGAFHTTPAMLAGLALAPLGLALAEPRQRRPLLVLLAFVLFWTAVMTVGPKKFDRYTLPTWPALLVLAAVGLASLHALALRLQKKTVATWAVGSIIAAALAVDAAQLWQIRPYFLSYYNPLLGGGAAAQRNLLIGWGEGMEQVASYLNEQPNPGNEPVLSTLGATLRPFLSAPIRPIERYGSDRASYAVVYHESLQRAADPPLYAKIQQGVPLKQIVINGITYATIYQVPRPYDHALPAHFGDELWLHGYSVAQSQDQLIITLSWDVRAQPSADYSVFFHLVDASGARVAQADVALGGGEDPGTRTWKPGRQVAVPIGLGLPPGLPRGSYALLMGVYDQRTGERLPFTQAPAEPERLDGPHVLRLQAIEQGE